LRKTILSTEFLVHGTLEYDEPGVFMAFEETAEELMQNAASLGFDLAKLVSR
jgi:circadian clock protein KaiC